MLSFGISWTKRTIALITTVVMLLTAGLFVASNSARADDLDDRMAAAKERQSDTNSQRDNLRNELSETDDQLASAYIELQEVQAKLPVAQAQLDIATKEYQEAQRQADALAQKLTDAQQEASSLETQISENDEAMSVARSGVAEMARQAARGDMDMSGVGLIVGAESTEDFVQRYNMNTTAMRSQSKSLENLRQVRAISRNAQVRLEAVNVVISALKDEADAKVVDAQGKQAAAAAAKVEVENLVAQQAAAAQVIESRKVAVEQQLVEQDASAASLADEIRKIAGLQEEQRAEEARKEKARQEQLRKEQEARDKANASKPSTGGSKPGSSNGGGSGSGSSGSGGSGSGGSSGGSGGNGNVSGSGWFSWPTAYRVVTSSYGMRLHPVLGYYRLHAGTDMRAYCGTPIYAGRSGTVQWSTWKSGFGNQVLINHGSISGNNVMSSYNHLTSFAVSGGTKVKAGQLIGYAGNTGLSGACHLHFEVYVNGSTIDPMTKM